MTESSTDPRAREMVADLARRLNEQAITIAERAAVHADAGRLSEGFKQLGRSQGYLEASQQVLLIARNL